MAELEACQQRFDAVTKGASEAYKCFEVVMPS